MAMHDRIKETIAARKAALVNGVKGLEASAEQMRSLIAETEKRLQGLLDNINATNGAIAECEVALIAVDDAVAAEEQTTAKPADDGLPTHMGEKPKDEGGE